MFISAIAVAWGTPADGAEVCVVDGASGDLGVATPYNAFVFGDFMEAMDVEGAVVACGDLTAVGFNFGYGLSGGDALIVGGDLTLTHGTVGGNAIYDGTATVGSVTFDNGGAVIEGSAIDCAAAQAELERLSMDYAGLAANGTVTNRYYWLTLTGTSPTLNVFSMTAPQLDVATVLMIDVPAGSTVLVNVPGASPDIVSFGVELSGATAKDILFNFYEATDLRLGGVSWEGSILAPLADVDFFGANMAGTLVARSLSGGVEMYDRTFGGGIDECPVVEDDGLPEITCDATYTTTWSWAEGFGASVQVTSSSALSGWTVELFYGDNPVVTDGWNGEFSRAGNLVTVTNPPWNDSTVDFGFNGTNYGGAPEPPVVVLNGVLCD